MSIPARAFPRRRRWPHVATIMVVAGLVVGGCDEREASPPDPPATSASLDTSSSMSVAPTTLTPQSAPATVAPSSTAAPIAPTGTAAPTTTALPASGPLEFVSGEFLGIRQGSVIADATSALGVMPVRLSQFDAPESVFACTGTEDPWIVRSGGLTLVFEEPPDGAAILTNWRYVGGSVGGFTEMIAPNGIRIGDTRDELIAASPDFTDLGDEIDVSTPTYLRFGLENDTVSHFGIIDCVFEGLPAD